MKRLFIGRLLITFFIIYFGIWNYCSCLYSKKLFFKKDSLKFKIMQVTDIHYGESDPKNDPATTNLMIKLINLEKPDLVAITGDAVSNYAWDHKKPDFYKDNWLQWSSAFNITQTPYAYTSGNHDIGADYSINQIIDLDLTHDYAVKRENFHQDYPETEHIYPITPSNFYIRIYEDDSFRRVAMILWFFDSGSDGCEDMDPNETWGCITSSQVYWYEQNSMLLNQELGYLPDGLAYFHIPIPEFRQAYNFRESYGIRGEAVNCPKKQTHVFDSLLKIGNIKGVFVGHDHNNDYCVQFYGVELCYGRKTGYGGYGPKDIQRGVRIIEISLEKNTEFFLSLKNAIFGDSQPMKFSYTNYILQEDGSVVEMKDYNRSFKGLIDFLGRCEKV